MPRRIPANDAARPAPFTPDQVAALVAGDADQKVIAKVLAAHRQPRLPAKPPARTRSGMEKPRPIAISAAELRELVTGETPQRIVDAFDAGLTKQRYSPGKGRKPGASPKRRPPL